MASLHEFLKKADEKPAMKWSFLTKIEVEDLASSFEISSRLGLTKAPGNDVLKYKLKLQYKRLLTPDPENIFNRYR